MPRRIWYMGRSASASTESVQDAVDTAEGLRQGLMSLEGVGADQLSQAQAFDRRRGFDRSPTHEAGVAGRAKVGGESFDMVQEHYNAHGQRITEVARVNESGRVEIKRIVEERAGDSTWVISDIKGAY
jgi:hypothetical protein